VRYLSVCSGIEAATVAWHPLGWRAAAYSEIEAFPRAVLSHHYPDVPLHGDFTTIGADEYGPIDLLVGGTPCQSFSVAGLRGGLADDRGNLALEFLRLADRTRAKWLVWENVPGVLSSAGGRDFGSILGGLVELGYGFAYRVLDAQHFGVPQRRRRVFVVGYLGDWRRAAAVLFERYSLQGHSAPRREKGERTTSGLAARAGGGGWPDGGDGRHDQLISGTLNAAFGSKLGLDNQHIDGGAGLFVTHALRGEGFDASEDGTGRGTPLAVLPFDTTQITSKTTRSQPGWGRECHTLSSAAHAPAIAFGSQMSTPHWQHDMSDTLQAKNPKAVASGATVRRLTPRECERLQGFPDDYTLIPYRGKLAADGPRYKALGNSMAVPVMRWIGERINMLNASADADRPKAVTP
jgi:DNA (cytosine-5)-methyltransferase 1